MVGHLQPHADQPKLCIGANCSRIVWPRGMHRNQAFMNVRCLHRALEEEHTDQLERFSASLWFTLETRGMTAGLRESDIGGMVKRVGNDTSVVPDELRKRIADTQQRAFMIEGLYRCIEEKRVDRDRAERYLARLIYDDKQRTIVSDWFKGMD